MSKALERQIARIEAKINTAAQEEPDRERYQRKAEAQAQERSEYFAGCIDATAKLLPDWAVEKIGAEFGSICDVIDDDDVDDDAANEAWKRVDIRTYGGFGMNNGLSALSNMALALALEIYKGKPVRAIPDALCRWFDEQAMEDFRYSSHGGNWYWLFNGHNCLECGLPLPTRTGFVAPFPACPDCGGAVGFCIYDGFVTPEQLEARR